MLHNGLWLCIGLLYCQSIQTSLTFDMSPLPHQSIMTHVDTDGAEVGRTEEIVKDHVDPMAKEALGIWLDQCACGQRNVDEAENAYLEKRDGLIKKMTIEIDLGSSFPRLFGPDIANRILGVIREVYNG